MRTTTLRFRSDRWGDCYDRYAVRVEEMRQSCHIIQQAMKKLPEGPIYVEDPKNILPEKEEVLTKMEELIQQFMIVTQGVKTPAGEIYFGAENPKGELGFYIYSKGGGSAPPIKDKGTLLC
jgi:NADH-quinone oxidoreductase subunit D